MSEFEGAGELDAVTLRTLVRNRRYLHRVSPLHPVSRQMSVLRYARFAALGGARTFKYVVYSEYGYTGKQVVKMHKNAAIIHAASQNGQPCIWATVNEEEPIIEREFEIIGTGWDVPLKTYIGTAHCGEFVWHIFE